MAHRDAASLRHVVAVMDAEMALVAAEQLVRPLADQRHLDVLARALADEVHRHDRRRGDRLLEAVRRSSATSARTRARSSRTGMCRPPRSVAVSAASASSSSSKLVP